MPWEGNVGPKRYFLGTREGEGLSDEDLFKLFLQKEGELFAAKNSQTPFQYIKTADVRKYPPFQPTFPSFLPYHDIIFDTYLIYSLTQTCHCSCDWKEPSKLEDKQKDLSEQLYRVKDDSRDASYEAWASQMTSLMLLRKEEQRSKQMQHVGPSQPNSPI